MNDKILNSYGYFGIFPIDEKLKHAGCFFNKNGKYFLSITSTPDKDITDFPSNPPHDIIYGILNDGTKVSLHYCYNKSRSFGIGSRSLGVEFYFQVAFIGHAFHTEKDKIKKIKFSTEHLFLWLGGFRGFSGDGDIKTRSCKIEFNNPGELKFKLTQTKSILLGFDVTIPGNSQDKDTYQIATRPFIYLKSSNAVEFFTLYKYALLCLRMLSFYLLTEPKITSFKVSSNGKLLDCIVNSPAFQNLKDIKSDRIVHRMHVIQTLIELISHSKNPFTLWYNFENKYSEMSRLFYQSINLDNRSLDSIAISLITAVESYNRIRTNQNKSLKDRLKEEAKTHKALINRKAKIVGLEKWAQKIADTRNYYAHILPNKEKKRLVGGALYDVIIQLRYLLVSIILQENDYTNNQIKDVFRKSFY